MGLDFIIADIKLPSFEPFQGENIVIWLRKKLSLAMGLFSFMKFLSSLYQYLFSIFRHSLNRWVLRVQIPLILIHFKLLFYQRIIFIYYHPSYNAWSFPWYRCWKFLPQNGPHRLLIHPSLIPKIPIKWTRNLVPSTQLGRARSWCLVELCTKWALIIFPLQP